MGVFVGSLCVKIVCVHYDASSNATARVHRTIERVYSSKRTSRAT